MLHRSGIRLGLDGMGWESLARAMLKASVYMIPRTAIIFVVHKVLLVHELQISCARSM